MKKPLVQLETVDAVVNAFGARPEIMHVAAVNSSQAITNWLTRGSFPPDTYVAMMTWLNEHGYTAEPSLWGQRQPGQAAAPKERPTAPAGATP